MKNFNYNPKHKSVRRILNTKYGLPVLLVLGVVILFLGYLNGDNTDSDIEFLEDEIVSGVQYEVEVSRFVDGDTTEFYVGGYPERFRYIIIDTPELDHQNGNHEPYALAAHERVQELLNGADVISVEFDSGEIQDNYDRFLAYVYADDVMLNVLLLEEGLATMRYTNTDNRKYFDAMREAEEFAQERGYGVWAE